MSTQPLIDPMEELKRRLAGNAPSATDLTNRRVASLGGELNRLNTGGDAISQISKPVDASGNPTGAHVSGLRKFGGVLARIGDTALTMAAPGFAMAIPGTSLHHRLLLNQTSGQLDEALGNQQEQAQTQDMQAQGVQRQALAEQEQAKAYNLTHPKPIDGQLLFDGNKNPIGFHDGNGRYFGPNDPDLPHGVGSVLAAARGKEPTNEFELWHQQNPDAPASAFFELKAANAPEKQKNRDDQAIAIMAKPPNTRTPEEVSFLSGYDQYIAKNKLAPAQIRANVMMQMPQQIADPNDPNRVIYTTRRNAIGQEAPASGDAAAARATTGYMTHGAGATTLTAGNTLTHHLDLYDKAVDAVNNGDNRIINQIGNELGIQMGNDAKTNLNLIQQGVAMEAARYYTGGVPGEHEIEAFKKSLSGDGSPRQMHGGANTVRGMARGKMDALKGQAAAGEKGQANFENTSSGMAVSLKAAMNLPQNKGKSEAEVKADIQAHGHEVRP